MLKGLRITLLAVLGFAPALAPAQGLADRFGLIPATPEQLRGIPLASTPYSGAELPRTVDLSPAMPPPQNQGTQRSCVGWAVAYALKTYQERVEEGRTLIRSDGRFDTTQVFSPAFVYNQINHGRDGGASFIDALNLVRSDGAATWANMPYDPQNYTRQPSTTARATATRFRIDTWRQVNVQDTTEMKAHLNAGFPVLIGARIDEGFLNGRGPFVWSAAHGRELGTHAMVVVGYDDNRQAFRVLNSWGREWGDGGFGWIAYPHFRRVATEAYVARDARNSPPPIIADNTRVPPPGPRPTPAPVRYPQLSLSNVQHNAIFPQNPAAGYHMRLDGIIDIPPGAARANQVVINFWFDAGNRKGAPVMSAAPQFATVYGQAAAGTAVYPVPAGGLRTTWTAWIPYSVMQLQNGGPVVTPSGLQYQAAQNRLLAEPVLYLDGFGVATGTLVPFSVTR
jgi:hypothetical protein